MSKKKRKRGKQQPRYKAHMVCILPVGNVWLPPSRSSNTPFCSYYGPHGETCSNTIELTLAWKMPSNPPVAYFACPLHCDAVHHMGQTFLARLRTPLKQG